MKLRRSLIVDLILLCLLRQCKQPVYTYSIDGFKEHYRISHPDAVIPAEFNETHDDHANEHMTQQIDQVGLLMFFILEPFTYSFHTICLGFDRSEWTKWFNHTFGLWGYHTMVLPTRYYSLCKKNVRRRIWFSVQCDSPLYRWTWLEYYLLSRMQCTSDCE